MNISIKYLIIGGTGTLGRETIKYLLDKKENNIFIMSRDELKQKQTSQFFKEKYSVDLKFIIGDIRDRDSVDRAFSISRPDIAFDYAALKHIDIMENNPEECIKTNIQGTINFADACANYGVGRAVFSSTDKAVYPINTYGLCKAISEKILLQRNKTDEFCKFYVFRWGNVIGSRGSVVNYFYEKIRKDEEINITDENMTRFWIQIDDAVKFIFHTISSNIAHSIVNIPKMKSSTILDVARAICFLHGRKPSSLRYYITGDRGGEKMHENIHHDLPHSGNCEKYTTEELMFMIKKAISNEN